MFRTAAAAALVLAACAAPATQRVYVAPTHESVTIGTEASMDGRGQHIWAHNRSSVPIVITSLQLNSCENIRNRCEVQRMERELAPGQRIRLTTVLPEDPNRPNNFRYAWTWHGKGDAPTLPGIDP